MPTGASVIPLRRLVGRNEGELLRREVVGDAPPRRSAKLSLLRVHPNRLSCTGGGVSLYSRFQALLAARSRRQTV
jgi:hypothetical protein